MRTHYEYEMGKKIAAHDYPFYALIQAAMRQADTSNLMALRNAFPSLWDEMQARYNAAGGRLEEDKYPQMIAVVSEYDGAARTHHEQTRILSIIANLSQKWADPEKVGREALRQDIEDALEHSGIDSAILSSMIIEGYLTVQERAIPGFPDQKVKTIRIADGIGVAIEAREDPPEKPLIEIDGIQYLRKNVIGGDHGRPV